MKSIILLNTNLPNNPPQERTKILDKTQIVFLKTPFSEFNGISLIRIVVHNCWSQFWKLLFGDRNLYSRFLKIFKGSRHMLQKINYKIFFYSKYISEQRIFLTQLHFSYALTWKDFWKVLFLWWMRSSCHFEGLD